MKSELNFVTPRPDGTVKFVLDNGWTGTRQRPVCVDLRDVSPSADTLSLGREGFVLTRIESAVTDYADAAQIEAAWKPAAEKMILEVTGAKWAALFAGPNIRFSETHSGSASTSVSAPARAVHSDLPGNFAFGQMGKQPVSENAMRILQERLGGREPKRWKIFNIWQMISDPPQDCTLALCDRSTLRLEDIVEGKGYFDDPDKPREEILSRSADSSDFDITFLRENPQQRWCYFANMHPGDALVFSAFDPQAGPGRWRVPHGAVNITNCGPGLVPRSSIEIRALAVFEE